MTTKDTIEKDNLTAVFPKWFLTQNILQPAGNTMVVFPNWNELPIPKKAKNHFTRLYEPCEYDLVRLNAILISLLKFDIEIKQNLLSGVRFILKRVTRCHMYNGFYIDIAERENVLSRPMRIYLIGHRGLTHDC